MDKVVLKRTPGGFLQETKVFPKKGSTRGIERHPANFPGFGRSRYTYIYIYYMYIYIYARMIRHGYFRGDVPWIHIPYIFHHILGYTNGIYSKISIYYMYIYIYTQFSQPKGGGIPQPQPRVVACQAPPPVPRGGASWPWRSVWAMDRNSSWLEYCMYLYV